MNVNESERVSHREHEMHEMQVLRDIQGTVAKQPNVSKGACYQLQPARMAHYSLFSATEKLQ